MTMKQPPAVNPAFELFELPKLPKLPNLPLRRFKRFKQFKPLRGFTLVEVLVALGIVAVALAAGVRATAALSRNAERQSDLLLAHLCAENTLVNLRLSRQMPAVGDNTSLCEQAGRSLSVKLSVQPTPNPNFLRTQAQVFELKPAAETPTPLLSLSTIVGRF